MAVIRTLVLQCMRCDVELARICPSVHVAGLHSLFVSTFHVIFVPPPPPHTHIPQVASWLKGHVSSKYPLVAASTLQASLHNHTLSCDCDACFYTCRAGQSTHNDPPPPVLPPPPHTHTHPPGCVVAEGPCEQQVPPGGCIHPAGLSGCS
jgi:hypothetical protein